MTKFVFPIAACFLFVSGFFVARVPDATRPELAGVSSLFVLLLALPSYMALLKWLGPKQGVLVLLALGVFAVAIEAIAVRTGFPYGEFKHGDKIGVKLFGVVPWTVPFAWTPLTLCSLTLAHRWVSKRSANHTAVYSVIALSALILVAIDLVLDPGAVAQEFWSYREGGLYYGVPLSNFLGWIFSGAIASGILYTMIPARMHRNPMPNGLLSSSFLILVFWTSVCLWMSLWLPTLIGAVLTVVIGHEYSKPSHNINMKDQSLL